jgi:SAM-dependent methyltransferase
MYVPVDEPAFWNEKYNMSKTDWDMKNANPVFAELLENSSFLKPCKILVVGSGKGYDAVIAAQKGYDTTAIDFSSAATEYAEKLAAENRVNIQFLKEDIFTLNDTYNLSFDIVYEYTTYCAINPSRREEFAYRISSLVKKGGRFITVLFPVDDRDGGPPFRIDLQEFYKNFSKYLSLEFSTKQINSIKPRKGKEVLQVYYKSKN